MKKIISISTFLCITFLLGVQCCVAQQYQWIRGGGTIEDLGSIPGVSHIEETSFMCTDQNNNIYAVSFVGNDPVVADTFHTSGCVGAPNPLITSYDCNGQMRWAKLITTTAPDGCNVLSMSIDTLGHLYVCGLFSNGTLHIGYDTSITGLLYEHLAIIQFDTNGHLNWIRYVGNNTSVSYFASATGSSPMVIDNANHVHILPFIGTGVPIMTGVTSHYGQYDIEYNSSGTMLNATRFQLDSTLGMFGAAIDKHSNKIYGYGNRLSGFSTAYGGDSSYYPFVACFDNNRNLLWKDTLSDVAAPGAGFGNIVTDDNNHIYLNGGGYGTMRFRNDSVVFATSFVMKIDTSGNPKWMRGFSQSGGNSGIGVGLTLMPGNKIAASAVIAGTVASDGLSATTYPGEGQNAFFAVLDTGGDVHYMQQLHGPGFYDFANVVVSDKIGNLFIGGQVASNMWGGSLPPYYSVGGDSDFFITKFGVACGCTSLPIASFTDTGNHVVGFTYTGTSSTSLDSTVWNFADGNTSTVLNPIHTYTVAGTYHVSVHVYSPCGEDIYFSNVTIPCVSAPTASFTYTGVSLTKYFTYAGSAFGLDSVTWNFGDGGHGTGLTSSHTYTTGAFTACVTAYNHCGSNTSCQTVNVINCSGLPVAAFTQTGTGTTHNFTYTGTTSYMDSVVWHFGDGGHAIGLTATHTYLSSGTFSACATVYTTCGWDSACTTITVPCTAAPVSAFTSTGISATRNFTYTGTMVALDSVTWNFGDGGHATGLTATHTYTATGSYNVCVTAYNPCGSNTVCSTVVITCVNHLTASYTHTGIAPVNFTYTGTTTGMDSVVWHYGDGGHGTGTTSSHSYVAIGSYMACALAYNHCGVDSSCSTISVPCVGTPAANFTSTGTLATHTFTYTGTMVALDSVTWNFGDGGHSVGLTPSHTYTAAGVYNVCVTAYSPCGFNTFCNTVVVLCVTAPVAAFTSTGSPAINFTYTGTAVGLDSVVWNFGDGNHATGLTTSHLYAVADTYNICVTAYNHCGWDSACSTVIVACPAPVASFTHIGAPAVNFNYTGTSVGMDSVVWHFGDGGSDTGISPTHSYAVSDTYHVCVIVYTLCGSDSACADLTATGLGISILSLANIQVYPNPVTDELNITGIPAITNYRILNVTGVSLQQGILQRGSNSIVMKNYAPGIYLMELTGIDGSKNIVRVVKQ